MNRPGSLPRPAAHADPTRRVTAEEYQAAVDVLRRMAANLGWAEPAA